MTAWTWLTGIDWNDVLAFAAAEVVIVLCLAPFFIQRKNEARAVTVFREKLLPLLPRAPTVDELVQAVRAELPKPPTVEELAAAVRAQLAPSPEEQEAARQQLAAAMAQQVQAVVPAAVQGAVAEAVKGKMGALSALATDGKMSKAAVDAMLKSRVGEKYGLKGLAGLTLLKVGSKELYNVGLDVAAHAPQELDKWLDDNAGTFGGNGTTKKAATNGLVRLG